MTGADVHRVRYSRSKLRITTSVQKRVGMIQLEKSLYLPR